MSKFLTYSRSTDAKPAVVPRLFSARPHPFPKLLMLERGLLGLAVIGTVLPAPFYQGQRYPGLAILMMLLFAALGLGLPLEQSRRVRVGFTLISLGLILLATVWAGNRSFILLHVVLLLRGGLLFRWPGQVAIATLTFTLLLAALHRQLTILPVGQFTVINQMGLGPLLVLVALVYLLCLSFVLLMMNALLAERRSRDQLALAHQQLQDYALRIEDQAMLEERNRIARDIHDSLGHALTGMNLQMEAVLKLWDPDPTQAKALLQEAKQLGSTALQEVRQSVATLRSPMVSHSLETDIHHLVSGIQRQTGLTITTYLQLQHPLPPEVHTGLYRIIQEALTNICKHAAATQVTLHLRIQTDQIVLDLQDDGQGFDVTQNTTGFGLQSMRERAQSLGGIAQIQSQPGAGCHLQVTLPLPLLTP